MKTIDKKVSEILIKEKTKLKENNNIFLLIEELRSLPIDFDNQYQFVQKDTIGRTITFNVSVPK